MDEKPRGPFQFGMGSLLWMTVCAAALVVAWQGGLLAWDEGFVPQFVFVAVLVLALPALRLALRNR